MSEMLSNSKADYRLTLDHKMTFQFATEIEEKIIDALRRYTHVEVDLSKVLEIDLCGLNLLGFLQCFTDKGLVIIATSPAVEQAYGRFITPSCTLKPVRMASSRPLGRGIAARRTA
jgi:hypothetical protein